MEVSLAPTQNNLRNLALAYMQSSTELKHPPRNAEEIRPYLTRLGDPSEILKSPIDGAELVIHWGTDLAALKPEGNNWPVWVYEKNAHGGKRWVLKARYPMEVTEEEFRKSLFAPGFKPPF